VQNLPHESHLATCFCRVLCRTHHLVRGFVHICAQGLSMSYYRAASVKASSTAADRFARKSTAYSRAYSNSSFVNDSAYARILERTSASFVVARSVAILVSISFAFFKSSSSRSQNPHLFSSELRFKNITATGAWRAPFSRPVDKTKNYSEFQGFVS
jgi:hypothetical protein